VTHKHTQHCRCMRTISINNVPLLTTSVSASQMATYYMILRVALLHRLTKDSPHSDRRRKDYNQAVFMDDGKAVFSSTDLDMIMIAFDEAASDIVRALQADSK
jgi:hypothetical protein